MRRAALLLAGLGVGVACAQTGKLERLSIPRADHDPLYIDTRTVKWTGPVMEFRYVLDVPILGTTTDGGGPRPPVFRVENGATLTNVIIGPMAADGIHCTGNCTLDHVWWEDIGEDAATALGPAGTVMNITCGAAYNGSDKTFQFNGRGEMRISNFYVAKAGKLVRSCGDCTGNGGPRRIFEQRDHARRANHRGHQHQLR